MISQASSDLVEPFELLDLEHGNAITLRIMRFEMGTMLIHPREITPRQIRLYMMQNNLSEPPVAGTPITIRVPAMRVFGDRVDSASPLHYWDITSKTLQASLYPILEAHRGGFVVVTLTANGYKPTKRYSIEVGG